MIHHCLQRTLVAVIRLAAVGMALFLLIEFSFSVVGGRRGPLWEGGLFTPVPAELVTQPLSWKRLLLERFFASGRVLLLAVPTLLLVGYAWGILGARRRRFRIAQLLSAPFAAFACVPGFCFVVLVAAYAYFYWQRPGFADELVVEQGPDLLAWWHAAVVALPAVAAGIAWQIRAVATELEREMSAPWVRGLALAGASSEEIFYARLLPRARFRLAALSDGFLPALLSQLVILEPAFRYPGLGSLLVDSIRLGNPSGILLAGLSLAWIATVATWTRELLTPPAL